MAPINRIYNRLAQFTWILAMAFLFASCTDMDINFQVNGEYAHSGAETLDQSATPDTATMLKVYVGDTVVFRNTTEPESEVRSIKWDIDGNGVVDERSTTKMDLKPFSQNQETSKPAFGLTIPKNQQ